MGMSIEQDALPALLDSFHSRVRTDALLGPVSSTARGDWAAEVKPFADLWASLMLTRDRHDSRSLRRLCESSRRAITLPVFERWLSLWRKTAGETLPPDGATAMQVKAARLSTILQRALGLRRAEA